MRTLGQQQVELNGKHQVNSRRQSSADYHRRRSKKSTNSRAWLTNPSQIHRMTAVLRFACACDKEAMNRPERVVMLVDSARAAAAFGRDRMQQTRYQVTIKLWAAAKPWFHSELWPFRNPFYCTSHGQQPECGLFYGKPETGYLFAARAQLTYFRLCMASCVEPKRQLVEANIVTCQSDLVYQVYLGNVRL